MNYDKDTYVKSNPLVQASVNNLTAPQNRLMAMLLITYVNNFDESSIEDTITLSRYDIMNYLGLSNSGQTYKNMNNTIRNFFQNSIVTWVDKDKSQNTTALFSNVKINNYDQDGDSLVEFTWNPYIKPHISNMKTEYTILVASNFLALKSKKSQTLYEFFHSYLNQGEITVYVDRLKELTECTSASYKDFRQFSRRGIKEPLEEINDKTDIKVEVLSKNKGNVNKRVIVSITFRVTNQQAKKVWFEEYPDVRLTDDQYKKLTQEFYIDGLFIGKRLVAKLQEVKKKKPDQIHNDFKMLEKYYKAELKKYEKEKDEENSVDQQEDPTKITQQELDNYLNMLKEGKL